MKNAHKWMNCCCVEKKKHFISVKNFARFARRKRKKNCTNAKMAIFNWTKCKLRRLLFRHHKQVAIIWGNVMMQMRWIMQILPDFFFLQIKIINKPRKYLTVSNISHTAYHSNAKSKAFRFWFGKLDLISFLKMCTLWNKNCLHLPFSFL